jgi:hypothetical protein
MITETMLLVAIRQKNWMQAEEMASEIALKTDSEHMETLKTVLGKAPDRPDAQYLLSLWAGIKWGELDQMEDDE